MKAPTMAGKSWMVATVAAVLVATASTSHGAALNTKLEVKCFDALAKATSKHQAAVAKARAKCRDGAISGKLPTGTNCETDADTVAAIDKSAAAIAKSVTSKCKSTCSVSGADCIDNLFCPPNGALPENCTAGAKGLPFSAASMGFPGSYCEAVLGGRLEDGAGFGACMAGLARTNADRVIELVYGSVDDTTGISVEAAKCVAAIAKALPKSAGKMAGAVSKCRSTQLGSDPATILANDCATVDAKASESLAKEIAKLEDTIDKKCTAATILELDLCGAGVGGVADVAAAKACLDDVLNESAYSIEYLEDRDYVDISLINAAYPTTTSPRCGDNLVNQIPSQFFRMGEECDGTDDGECPGNCLPPGDVYQCTCSTTPRLQSYTTGSTSDFDIGWSGASHNQRLSDGAGFVSDIVAGSCNCSAFGGLGQEATCVGTTTDPICDVYGAMGPRCTYAPYDGTTCDAHGNNNGIQSDTDCQVCDENSTNAGVYCTDESGCGSQCFNPAGDVTGLCERQSDCAAPDICRGRCDKETARCNVLNNGAPLPLSAQGSSVCDIVKYNTDVTGTRNIVTGEHAVNFDEKVVNYLSQSASRPCPICGGFCTGPSSKVGEICEGTCTGPATECRGGENKGIACVDDGDCPGSKCLGVGCRFDDDCAGNGTCSGANSPECVGQTCQLALVCAGGTNEGRECRIEAATQFGTTSIDCPSPEGQNISGAGLHISYTPLTSEAIELEDPGTCDTPGFENVNGCYCVLGGGSTRSQPNRCAPACTATGVNYGRGCGGNYTTCVGGPEAGAMCDEDADCSGGGTCSANPKICDGGVNDDLACTSGADCTGGACVDACPGGICTPLCEAKGVCNGGVNDGLGCGVAYACPGGTCDVTDPEEGVCAAGPPLYNCNGKGHEFRPCLPVYEGTTNGCEGGVDNVVGNEDDYVGAGTCVATVRGCFVDSGHAEGGDTLNGQGGPTQTKSVAVFCIAASSSSAVNSTAGMPGPGRLREHGVLVPNFSVLP
ncbi:MAG: hypothetical protein HY899_19055 [Deltaproteobacteria bacterium]|nr:hypothetical protein [Deltaproteobacteria bacterium]